MSFIHLNTHSEFSIIESTLKVKEIVSLAKENNQPAVGITDIMNMSSLVKFYSAANAAGIKPIIGATLNVEDEGSIFIVTAICINNDGYLNLSKLISKSYKENQPKDGFAVAKKEWLFEMSEGLIILSGLQSNLSRASNLSELEFEIYDWKNTFLNRFYIELTRTGRPDEYEFNELILSSLGKLNLPVVAGNSVVFNAEEDFEAHEIRVCINRGELLENPGRSMDFTAEQHYKTPQEMSELFKDIPSAIENTYEIAKRSNVKLTLGAYFLPDFPVPEGHAIDSYFIEESQKGLEERLNFLFGSLPAEEFKEARKEYDERLKYELDIILQMGFPGYFFIVADFIQWAKNNDIPVGPGRGSGAGSLVAYSLKITDLDPLEYDLLFERFLNPERVSMPDFDVDFCMEQRDDVIDYVSKTYGSEQVSQIITFGTMAARSVIRDVGRVLGAGYGFVDSIAKLVPEELGITLSEALNQDPDFKERYDSDNEAKEVIDIALKLEGVVRNTGKHAGGVVIGPKPLYNFCPTSCEADGSSVVTQLDKNDVETAGLVKFDFLGLRTLTIVDWVLKEINKDKKKEEEGFLDILRIPLNDKKTFDMIKTGKTTGVFQLESSGMQKLIKKLKPDCFEDIIALVALFRPGPLESGMVDNFIARKHGKEKVSYPDVQYQHDSLKETLEPTYGVILYQEQVMQIAQILAGYTLGEADLLRRAMGKKKPEEMAKQRSIFKEGAIKNNVDGDLAMKIFDLVEKFAGYGFNKSHSAAYALVSYQAAWLKAHYPVEFMAAQISSDMDNTDKVVHMIKEAKNIGLEFEAPDINLSLAEFKPGSKPNCIRYGIGAIKGVGDSLLDKILIEKEATPFTDFFDFCKRIKPNKRALTSLIHAGAFDSLSSNRADLVFNIEKANKLGKQASKMEDIGQLDLFGEGEIEKIGLDEAPFYPYQKKMKNEFSVLGLYLSGHPILEYREFLDRMNIPLLSSLKPVRGVTSVVAGVVMAVKKVTTKSGDEMIIANISDESGELSVVARAGQLGVAEYTLIKGELVEVEGEISKDFFSSGLKIDCDKITSILSVAQNVHIYSSLPKDIIKELTPFLTQNGASIKLEGRDILSNKYLVNNDFLNVLETHNIPYRVEI